MYTIERPPVGPRATAPDTMPDAAERQRCLRKVYAILREVAAQAKAASTDTPRDETRRLR